MPVIENNRFIKTEEEYIRPASKIVEKEIENKKDAYEPVVCKWAGFLVFSALVAYFLIMKAFGLYQILELRYFNAIFLITGIVIAFYNFRKKVSPEGIQYLKGIKMGMKITLIAVLPFVIFMGIYLAIDKDFMAYIIENGDFGQWLSPVRAAGVIAIEGLISGAIITFMAMQYFKSN